MGWCDGGYSSSGAGGVGTAHGFTDALLVIVCPLSPADLI